MTAWMIRAGRGGVFAAKWLEEQTISIGWDLCGADIARKSREEIRYIYEMKHEVSSAQEIAAAVGQVYRFATEMTEGSTIVMYDPSTRLYHIGEIIGPCVPSTSDDDEEEATYMRKVKLVIGSVARCPYFIFQEFARCYFDDI